MSLINQDLAEASAAHSVCGAGEDREAVAIAPCPQNQGSAMFSVLNSNIQAVLVLLKQHRFCSKRKVHNFCCCTKEAVAIPCETCGRMGENQHLPNRKE